MTSMNHDMKDGLWVDGRLFNENHNKFPEEQLLRYAGKHVVWNLDGTQILACGADETEIEQRLRELGIDRSRVVGEYIPPPDTVVLS